MFTLARDYAAQARTASGINILLGIWLIVSPWVFDYSGSPAVLSSVVVGAVIALLAAIRLASLHNSTGLSGVNLLLSALEYCISMGVRLRRKCRCPDGQRDPGHSDRGACHLERERHGGGGKAPAGCGSALTKGGAWLARRGYLKGGRAIYIRLIAGGVDC